LLAVGRQAQAARQALEGGSGDFPADRPGDLLAALDRAAARKVTILSAPAVISEYERAA
jgi:hypothetical protein